MPDLDFSLDDNHVYRLKGEVIPGCTSVLKALGCYAGLEFISPEERQWHGERGHAIAKGVELSCRGELDKRTIDKTVRPYMVGWERAQNDLGIAALRLHGEPFAEVPLCHRVYKYGVKPDVVGHVAAHKDTGVIEIKATANRGPATAIQTAAQLIAVRAVMPGIGKLRAELLLLPKEPYYKFRVFTDPMDEVTWISMLNTYRWLSAHKLLKQNGGR
jgi:hypothetical protein